MLNKKVHHIPSVPVYRGILVCYNFTLYDLKVQIDPMIQQEGRVFCPCHCLIIAYLHKEHLEFFVCLFCWFYIVTVSFFLYLAVISIISHLFMYVFIYFTS